MSQGPSSPYLQIERTVCQTNLGKRIMVFMYARSMTEHSQDMQVKNWFPHLYLVVRYQKQKVETYIWRTTKVKYTMSLSPQTQ